MNLDFYKNKSVFITGHTGFKGSWLAKILKMAGANVTGYALAPSDEPNLFELSGICDSVNSITGDIRDFDLLMKSFKAAKPEIVFHLAAQPIVSVGYDMPRYTFETNIMGTVNILECIRVSDCVKSFVNVTTDKVYKNNKNVNGYKEGDMLDGFDPYSNSKSCSELVTHSYKNSFFENGAAISTVRAGNVIGGGDFAKGRIIPDCIRAVLSGEDIEVFNPSSVRPYQHVLESLAVYLMLAEKQYEDSSFAGYYNVGPDDCDYISTGELVQLFCDKWGGALWKKSERATDFYESDMLRLDCSKLKSTFNRQPQWHIDTAIEKTVEWARVYRNGGNINEVMEKQIKEFFEGIF